MGDCVTHARYAQNRIADTISIKISCASYRSFFIKASYPTQCCPGKALAWMAQIRKRIRVCQRIMKTPARLHVMERAARQCLRNFFKRKMWLGKKLILPSDFKTIPFENFILWEIAARKLDSSPVPSSPAKVSSYLPFESQPLVGQDGPVPAASKKQRHRSDCHDVKTSVFVC